MTEDATPMLANLSHVAIKTNDLAATRAFHRRILGLGPPRAHVAGSSFFHPSTHPALPEAP